MTWKQFVRQWKPSNLISLKIPESTVFAWRAGTKEPSGWQREAAEFWIGAKLPPVSKGKASATPAKQPGGKA